MASKRWYLILVLLWCPMAFATQSGPGSEASPSAFVHHQAKNSGDLGVDRSEIPPPPESRRPTEDATSVQRAVSRGKLPRVLVPIRYLKNGRLLVGKYYDQDGQIYRIAEVELILGSVSDPTLSAAFDEYMKFKKAGRRWSMVALPFELVGIILWPALVVAIPFLIVSTVKYKQGQEPFATALSLYNEGQR